MLHLPERGSSWASAVSVSLLWGAWHLPITPSLSWLWRRSGNLALPGGAHAILDGVRNALVA